MNKISGVPFFAAKSFILKSILLSFALLLFIALPAASQTCDTWVTLAPGHSHSAALRADGTLWTWGFNSLGQLGDGTTTAKHSPAKIGTDNNWAAVSSGYYHTAALKTDGTLWTWGWNQHGQLGNGSTVNKTLPVQIGTDSDWVAVSAGFYQTLALKSDGTLWAWGDNGFGQLGNGTGSSSLSPIKIGTDNDWASVSTGMYHSGALKTDGTLWTWGYNGDGRMGDGTTTGKLIPTQIGTDNDWTIIVAGDLRTAAMKSDGTLWVWGYNNDLVSGVGGGSNANILSPAQIGTDHDWTTEKSFALMHNAALKTDGTLWTWGRNDEGQLGDGTTANKYSPVKIGTDSDWVDVYAGGYHTLALKSDGTLWTWGANNNGQLGDGTTTFRSVPGQITTGTTTCTVSCTAPPANMTAWFPLDETAGTSSADLAGVSNTGTHFNNPTPVPGEVDGALNFDGVDDYVEAADHSELNFDTGDFSIDAWITADNVSGIRPIVEKRSALPTHGYSFFLYNGNLYLQLADASGTDDYCTSAPTSSCTNYGTAVFVADGNWHHVAVTVTRNDTAGIRFYVDGALAATENPASRPGSLTNSAPFRIGNKTIDGNSVFKGTIDELELFNRALSDAEISSIWAAGSDGKCKPVVADTTPDPFSFTSQTGVALNTVITSNTITVSGINASATVSVSGGAYSINGGAYTSAAGTVDNGDTVNVRLTSSSSLSTTTIATLTIGGVSGAFSVTTTGAVSYTITASAGANGSISPSGSVSVASGGLQSFKVTPDAGYRVARVIVDGASIGAVTKYDFINVVANHTIYAEFTLDEYSITASIIIGSGTITPPGVTMVSRGGSQAYTIHAGPGYYIAWVVVDGVDKGALTSYTFSNVTADHTIRVYLKLIAYTITSGAGAGGSISPSGSVTVAGGSEQSFAITPDAGFYISDVLVDGVSAGAVTSYKFSNVLAPHTISASFAVNSSYTISESAGANGSISPMGNTTVTGGSKLTCIITPDTGYRVANVIVDGVSMGSITRYNFINIMANHTISASFILDEYSITASTIGSGTITPAGVTMVSKGGSQIYTITPDPGYYISSVIVDGSSKGALSTYTFTNVKSNRTIKAYFKK